MGVARWSDLSPVCWRSSPLGLVVQVQTPGRLERRLERQLQDVLEMLYPGPAREAWRKTRDTGHWPPCQRESVLEQERWWLRWLSLLRASVA